MAPPPCNGSPDGSSILSDVSYSVMPPGDHSNLLFISKNHEKRKFKIELVWSMVVEGTIAWSWISLRLESSSAIGTMAVASQLYSEQFSNEGNENHNRGGIHRLPLIYFGLWQGFWCHSLPWRIPRVGYGWIYWSFLWTLILFEHAFMFCMCQCEDLVLLSIKKIRNCSHLNKKDKKKWMQMH